MFMMIGVSRINIAIFDFFNLSRESMFSQQGYKCHFLSSLIGIIQRDDYRKCVKCSYIKLRHWRQKFLSRYIGEEKYLATQ